MTDEVLEVLQVQLAALLADNQRLGAANERLGAALTEALALIDALKARIAELERLKTPPAHFVKANKPTPDPADKKTRKKRAPIHNHARKYDTPTQIRKYALANCPKCSGPLSGNSIARRRQVIDIPPPAPVEIIEYHLIKGYCAHCEKYFEPELILDGLVVGHSRVSVRITSLIGWLRIGLRLPIRSIKTALATMYRLDLSIGEITELLHTLAKEGKPTAETFKKHIRSGQVVHADETGWREAGRSGYVWLIANPDGTSYFHYSHSRAGKVSRELLGEAFKGTLCSDFYCGYNQHTGPSQRCWAHLLRDLKALVENNPGNDEIAQWVGGVIELYETGKTLDEREMRPSQAERDELYRELVEKVRELGKRWARQRGHPGGALCKRLLRHDEELFQYVAQAEVAATNNFSERKIRPIAVVRNISGDTKSPVGSETRMILHSLYSSWAGRGLDPMAECLKMLGAQTPVPSS